MSVIYCGKGNATHKNGLASEEKYAFEATINYRLSVSFKTGLKI
jgi:hypothetical protein